MRIAVTGSRDWRNAELLRAVLATFTPCALGVGDCPTGADKMALSWAKDAAYAWETYEAYWDTQGLAAGPIRNRRMLDEWKPELLVAFKRGQISKGTTDCIRAAKERSIPYLLVWDPS